MLAFLYKLFGQPRTIAQRRAELWRLHRLANSTAPSGRYYLRDDEVCRDDMCVVRVREAGG